MIESFFPDLTPQVNAMVVEAGLSRMYAGIHYRFDIEQDRRSAETLRRSQSRRIGRGIQC